ncbi:MAG: hypothetical protein WCJ71_07145 [Candidatus Omnitrophota bacterium]
MGLIDGLMKLQNVIEGRGNKIVFPNAITQTHSALPGEPANLGIWWFHVPSRKLLFSTSAWAHIDSEFVAQIPELGLTRAVPNKFLAVKAGWISGRLGLVKDDVFAFLYAEEVAGGVLPGSVAADLLNQLQDRAGRAISFLVDENGMDLVDKLSQDGK